MSRVYPALGALWHPSSRNLLPVPQAGMAGPRRPEAGGGVVGMWLCCVCICAAQLCRGKPELCMAMCTVYKGRGHSGVGVCPAWGTVLVISRAGIGELASGEEP